MDVFELSALLTLNTSEYESKLEESAGKASGAGSKIGSALSTMGKIGAVGFAAAGAAVVKLTSDAVSAYADYEQLVGGVETLFGTGGRSIEEYADFVGKSVDEASAEYQNLADAQQYVLNRSSAAWDTAGLSANAYMETVTGFSASLIQSLGGDTLAAAKLSDQAIIDMSDNANKMGTNMQSIQNAYSGFAKGNFMMLDNLKLGYGGTKTEMERLLDDAEKIKASQGEMVEYSIDSYADMIEAIHTVQTEMGITGTTAKEGATTVSGSAARMKAAWANVVTNFAKGGTALSESIWDLVASMKDMFSNLVPVISNSLAGIGQFLQDFLPYALEQIPALVTDLAPKFIDAVMSLFTSVITLIPELIPQVIEVGTQVVGSLADTIGEKIPDIWDKGTELIGNFGMAMINNIPVILAAAADIISNLFDTIGAHAPEMMTKGFDLIGNLAMGIISNLPSVISSVGKILVSAASNIASNLPTYMQKGFELIGRLASGILQNLPAIISAIAQVLAQLLAKLGAAAPSILSKGIELLGKLAAGIIQGIPKVIAAIPQVISGIIKAFTSTNWGEVGGNIIKGIASGITSGVGHIVEAAKSVASNALAAAKRFLGIASPSKVMRDQVGKMIPAGIAEGIYDNMGVVQRAMDGVTGVISEPNVYLGTYKGAVLSSGQTGLTKAIQSMTDAVTRMDENMTDRMADALDQMGFNIDRREFARLVREVRTA